MSIIAVFMTLLVLVEFTSYTIQKMILLSLIAVPVLLLIVFIYVKIYVKIKLNKCIEVFKNSNLDGKEILIEVCDEKTINEFLNIFLKNG